MVFRPVWIGLSGLGCMQVIAEHFFHQGQFKAGEIFLEEAGIPEGEALKEPFSAMHEVLKEVGLRIMFTLHRSCLF